MSSLDSTRHQRLSPRAKRWNASVRASGDEPLLSSQVLILDEPTTALDILTQRTIIDLLVRLKADLGFSMLFIS